MFAGQVQLNAPLGVVIIQREAQAAQWLARDLVGKNMRFGAKAVEKHASRRFLTHAAHVGIIVVEDRHAIWLKHLDQFAFGLDHILLTAKIPQMRGTNVGNDRPVGARDRLGEPGQFAHPLRAHL